MTDVILNRLIEQIDKLVIDVERLELQQTEMKIDLEFLWAKQEEDRIRKEIQT